jgi:TM2 domain
MSVREKPAIVAARPHSGQTATSGQVKAPLRVGPAVPSGTVRMIGARSPDGTTMHFRHKALAALLAFLFGGLGLHRLYLGQSRWWLPLAVTLAMIPLLIGVRNWYQTPAFFVAMVPVAAGFIEALVIALTPDPKFDARFNPAGARTNQSGWDAVLVAILTLLVGTTVLMTTIVLLFQTYFEYALGRR